MVAGSVFKHHMICWTRNIWHVLLIHFVNNALLSLGGLILLKILQMVDAVENRGWGLCLVYLWVMLGGDMHVPMLKYMM